jgi:spermidine/putrescine transport system permease protein
MIVKNLPLPKAVQQRVSGGTLALIGLATLAILFVVPIALLFRESLNLSGPGSVFVHYETALSSIYLETIIRSFLFGLATTIVSLILAYSLAYYIVFHSKYKLLLLGLVILPFWVAYIIRYLGIQLFFSPTGPFVGLFGSDVGVLFSPLGVIVGLASALLPFAILPIYNSLDAIDKEMIDASQVMGAGRLRTFRSVTLPLSLSGVVAGGLIEFILATGSFLAPAILGGPGETMIANLIAEVFSSAFNIELASALAMIYTVVLTAVLLVFNSVVDIGEVLGDI